LNKYSLIGTTEEEFDGDLDDVEISTDETNYLVSIFNLYFKKSITRSDIVHSYAGVRPLIDESGKSASRVSRDYRLELSRDPHPILSVYGGKVTTYRVLADAALNKLGRFFPRMQGSWTRRARLPGGDFEMPEDLFHELASKYGWLGPDLLARWQSSYGTLSFKLLENARRVGDLGVKFGNNLYQREVDYLCSQEWAITAEDILWRRSKLGYQFTESERTSLSNYIEQSYPIN
jgi:glycerol-3-phosphate dehydrogenase